MKKLSSIQGVALLLSLLFLFTNCAYYKFKPVLPTESITNHNLGSPTHPAFGKPAVVIVHLGEESWQLNNYTTDQNSIKGELIPVNKHISFFYELAKQRRNFYVRPQEKAYAKQVHLYVNEMSSDGTMAEVNLKMLTKCEVISRNRGLQVITSIPIVIATPYLVILTSIMFF
jgi:hypothetical protein